MKPQIKAILLIVIFVAVGIFIGTQIGSIGLTAPTDHKTIAQKVKVKDITINFDLSLRFVQSQTLEWGKPELAVFNLGKEYKQSTWLWERYGDAEFAMTIWGPGDDGTTYFVELGKLGGHAFNIYYEGNLKFTSPEVNRDKVEPAEGYYWFYVP